MSPSSRRWDRYAPFSAGNEDSASSAAFGKIAEQYVGDIQHFAESHHVPLVPFEKGESKEERVRPLLRQAAKDGGEGKVVLIGVAQEKASAWRSWKAKGQEKA